MNQSRLESSTALESLRHRRRRRVLDALAGNEDPMRLVDLADEVAGRERDQRGPGVREGDAEHVRLSLYHTHLPKLAGVGLVAYDRKRNSVALADRGERAGTYRELLEIA